MTGHVFLKICVSSIFLLSNAVCHSQDTVKLLFVYGSKPKVKQEQKWFGGIHGGHVSVQYQKGFASFVPNGKFHVFRHKKDLHSKFVLESGEQFVYDTSGSRYMIVSVPVTKAQRQTLDSVIAKRLEKSPYDYAFMGMRCASSAYELLSTAGILPSLSQRGMIKKYFYPKKLRKKVLSLAKENHWSTYYRPGRTSRKWEKD
jgi:hypothetical protein